jgi:hypothetical protein
MESGINKGMDPKIWRHIGVWATTTIIGYAICVGVYFLLSEIQPTVFSKPFIFICQKLISSVIGISIITGATVFIEVVSKIPVYSTLKEAPIALAIYVSTVLYVVGWIWNYS